MRNVFLLTVILAAATSLPWNGHNFDQVEDNPDMPSDTSVILMDRPEVHNLHRLIPKGDLRFDYTPRYPRSDVLGYCREDDFKIQTYLGSGAFGRGYEAIHRPSGHHVAIKEFKRPPSTDKEETVPMKFHHPNIMRHHCSYIRRDGAVALVSDFYSGGRLLSYVEKGRGSVSSKTVIKWIAQMYSAARHIHDKGIAHTDYSLKNLLVDHHKNLMVIDFGNAKFFSWTSFAIMDIDYRLEMIGKEYRKMALVVRKLCDLLSSEKRDACLSFHRIIGVEDRNQRVKNCHDGYGENRNHRLFRDFNWSSLPN